MTDRSEPGDLLAQTRWLRALAAGLLGDDAAAEDAVQETWLAALRRPPEPRESLRPWLATVLRNLVRSRWRADRQREKREVRASEESAAVATPEELLSEHEELRAIAEMVSVLAEPYRTTVLLCYQRGLSPTEIARQQELPAGTVRWRLKQALDELRGRLDERHGGDRRKWRALLVPVAWRPREAAAATATALLLKLGALLGVVLVAGALWVWRARTSHPTARPLTAAEMRQRVRLTTAPTTPPAPIDFGSIDGRVTNPDGSPAAGASVFVMRPMSLYEQRATAGALIGPLASATADGSGAFHLTAPAGRCAVYALGEKGRPVGREPIDVPAGGTAHVELSLLAGGFTLEGHVLDAGGGAIAGARVVIDEFNYDFNRSPRFYEVRSDERGHYAFHVGAGHYTLRAAADGYARDSHDLFVVRDQRMDLRLYPGARFSGRVIDRETRQPVAGADVSLVAFDQLAVSAARAPSGEQGEFSFADVRGDAYRVMATLDGRVGASSVVRAASAESADGIEVAIGPGLAVRGKVIDQAGKPVGGAVVALRAQKPPLERFPLARTSADGSFAIVGLFPGALTVHAEAEGHGAYELPLTLNGEAPALEIRLPAATVVSGTVLGSDGQPVEGAVVSAGSFASTTSGAGGVFRISSVVPGEVMIVARHPERGVASEEPRRLRAGEILTLTLKLGEGATVEGVVRDQAGAPVAGVKVVAGGSIGSYQTLTDQEGRYRLTGLPAGRLGVWALRKDRSLVSSTEKRPDQRFFVLAHGEVRTVDLTIAHGGERVGGVVVDPAGQPLSGANLSLRASRNGPDFNDAIGDTTLVSDQGGRFLFDDLAAGSYTLRAWHPRFGEVERAGIGTGSSDVRLAFAPSGGLAGSLRRADGRPVAHATLRVLTPRANPTAAERSMPARELVPVIPVHDPAGSFVIEPLAPGRYVLEATTLEGDRGALDVTIEPGPRAEVRVVIAPTVRLVGRVVDRDTGEGLGGITVGVSDELGYHDVQSRPDGSFSLGGLAEATPVYASVSDRANLHLGEGLKLEPAAGTLRIDAGTIRLRTGDPRKESLGISWTIDDGRMRLLSVAEGSPGDRAGLRAKDVLLAVNGEDASTLPVGAFRYQLGSQPTTTLTVQAPGQPPRTVTLRRPPR